MSTREGRLELGRLREMKERIQEYWKEWRKSPLLVAFLCSCLVHLILFALWRTGMLELPDQLVQFFVKRKVQVAQKPPPPKLSPTNAPPVPKEIPLAFIEIDSSVATPQAPKDAKFYSSANSVAANPDPARDSTAPKADGKQEKIPKLRDVPRATLPAPAPPPPTPTPPPPAPAPAPAPTPKPELAVQPTPPIPAPKAKEEPAPAPVAPGNTEAPKPPKELAKVDPPKTQFNTEPSKPSKTPPAEPPKPRTRSLAQARKEAGLVGDKMKQEGGVRRAGKLSVDTRATLFGEYDAEFIRAVQERWIYLMDNSSVALRSGRVVLQFNLRYDGAITDMVIKESEVGQSPAYLCQRAVTDPSPYAKWPADMHRTVGANFRVMVFTFLYY